VNRWKRAEMPRLKNGEEQLKALSFLNQRGLKDLHVDEVQLWLTVFRDGAFAKYRDLFQQPGSNFFRLTNNAIMTTVVNPLDGDVLFTAIQDGMNKGNFLSATHTLFSVVFDSTDAATFPFSCYSFGF
jgi:hypothetical protein